MPGWLGSHHLLRGLVCLPVGAADHLLCWHSFQKLMNGLRTEQNQDLKNQNHISCFFRFCPFTGGQFCLFLGPLYRHMGSRRRWRISAYPALMLEEFNSEYNCPRTWKGWEEGDTIRIPSHKMGTLGHNFGSFTSGVVFASAQDLQWLPFRGGVKSSHHQGSQHPPNVLLSPPFSPLSTHPPLRCFLKPLCF